MRSVFEATVRRLTVTKSVKDNINYRYVKVTLDIGNSVHNVDMICYRIHYRKRFQCKDAYLFSTDVH